MKRRHLSALGVIYVAAFFLAVSLVTIGSIAHFTIRSLRP